MFVFYIKGNAMCLLKYKPSVKSRTTAKIRLFKQKRFYFCRLQHNKLTESVLLILMCKVKEYFHKCNLLSKSFSANCSAIFLCFSLFLKGSIYVYKKGF